MIDLLRSDPSSLPDRLAENAFVGRREEMAQLEIALADACAGKGRIALLAGAPGIGKTRTASELADRARARNARVIVGRCYEGDGAPAYWPWVQVIRSSIAGCEPSSLRTQLRSGAVDLAQLVPEIRERLPGLPDAPSPAPDQARFRLFDSVTTYLKTIASARPIVLSLDDLHRADPPSLSLLHFVAQHMAAANLLVLGSYRDVDVGPEHPLDALLAELVGEPHLVRISLRGLPDVEVRALVATQAGASVPNAVLCAIARKTEGNPLFVKEMWRHLSQERLVYRENGEWRTRLAGEELGVPEGVRQVIGRRLSRRSHAARYALALASVFGREFHVDVLQRLAGIDEDELSAVLDEAQQAHLIEDFRGPSGPAYRFSHALVQETLYDGLSAVRRQRLHLQAGQALEELRARNLEPYVSELAHHFTIGNDAVKAIDYSRRAGEAAYRIYAWEPAIQHWKVALELFEVHGGEPRDRTALVDRLDELTFSSGIAFELGSKFLVKELAIQEALGDRAKVAAIHARLGFRAVAHRGRYFDLRSGFAHLERARAILEQESPDSLELVHVYQNLDQACIYTIQRALGEDYARKSLALLERLDHPSRAGSFTREPRLAVGLSMIYLAVFRAMAGELRTAFDLLERVWSICDQEDHALGAYFSSFWIALFELGYRRDVRAARSALERELAKPRQAADSYPRAVMLLLLGQIHIRAGEMESARSLRHAADAFGQLLAGNIDLYLSDLFAAEGDWQALEERAERGLEESQRYGDDWSRWRFAHDLGALCLRRGQHERAEELLRICLEIDEREQMPAYSGMSHRVMTAQLLARTGRLKEARGQLDVCFDVLGRGEDWGGTVGRIALAHGAVLAAERRWSDAERELEQALAVARKYGLPWDEADALDERARLHCARDAQGDRARASLLLDAELAIYERLGARRHRDLVVAQKRELDDVDPLQSQTPLDAAAAPEPLAENLFRREGEYWTIAYDGTLIRLRDSRGLHYIAHLILEPGRDFHVTDLAQTFGGGASALSAGDAREVIRQSHAGELLDARARSEYRESVAELRAELEEATDSGDLARANRARAELEAVSDALTAAYGLGRRIRTSSDPVERVRKAVTKCIKESVAKIDAQNAALGRHLANAIRTGAVCSYTPERPVAWIVEIASP